MIAVLGSATLLILSSTSTALAVSAPSDSVPIPTKELSPDSLPLHTQGSSIVDHFGRRVQLRAASWYGGESIDFVPGGLQKQPLNKIAQQIRQLGLNTIRLPWSNQMFESNPNVPGYAVAANPDLRGRPAMEVFDRVIQALTEQGIMVILDNHNSNAEWCCGDDGNDLWYNAQYPESSWLKDWQAMVARYSGNPLVIGADLRNEPRLKATWGGPLSTNWQAAAERGGDAVHSVNPNLLIFVEGISYAGDLSRVEDLPVVLNIPDRVVYVAHDYPWFEHNFSSYQQWYDQVYPKWGYLIAGPDPQPLFVDEFGTDDASPNAAVGSNGFWFNLITTFLQRYHLDWAYWALNGTQSTGQGRTWNALESYGILNTEWDGVSNPALVQRLRQI